MAVGSEEQSGLLCTVPEGARLLGIGRTLMWRRINASEIPVVRLGNRVLVRRDRLYEIAAQEAPHKPATRRKREEA